MLAGVFVAHPAIKNIVKIDIIDTNLRRVTDKSEVEFKVRYKAISRLLQN